MFSKVKQLFDEYARDIRRLSKLVDQVNKLEPQMTELTDEQLRNKTEQFKQQLAEGKSTDDIKVEAFAVVREAAKRVLGMRHYDVQLIGGFILSEGQIAEMSTGEGKTLVATLPSYLHALTGKGVHVITANEYLARRDKEQMGKLHEFLGLTVGLNISSVEPSEKTNAYGADITYGTGTEFGFDYLRDNMVTKLDEKVQRPHYYAIIDEIDSILIDEARTPLIIANKNNLGTDLCMIMATIIRNFKQDTDYEYVTETKQVFLKDEGATKIEDLFGLENLYDAEHQELLHAVMQSLRAHVSLKLDVDYIIKDGKVMLVDQFTGRVLDGRTFSDGLHQAIEAKEGVEITEENETRATITVQNYFRMYKKISGMTGSALPAKKEFFETYGIHVIKVPTNRECIRVDHDDLVYAKKEDKLKRIVAEVKQINALGRPILIGTTSIRQSEELAELLKQAGVKYEILNAKNEEDEAELIVKAGQHGKVMIATNMAGRGTDIILGEGVAELGGLHILGTERHESQRIDMQLRGRAGRQGDPGSSQFIISLEDELLKYYDDDELEKYKAKMAVNAEGLVTSPNPNVFIKKVQETVENMFYDSRAHILKLDNVLDRQAKIIYQSRDRVLRVTNEEVLLELISYIEDYIKSKLDFHCNEELFYEDWNSEAIYHDLSLVFVILPFTVEQIERKERIEIEALIWPAFEQLKEQLAPLKDDESLAGQLKLFMLQAIDVNWIRHLETMTTIKDGIHLRSYGQEDPYRHFEMGGLEEFNQLLVEIQSLISIQFIEFLKHRYELAEE